MRKLVARAVYTGNLYYQTLRHLRAEQFIHRALYRSRNPRPNLDSAPPLRALPGIWHEPPHRGPSFDGVEIFRFLNVEGALSKVGWDGDERSKLWRYNQHYFDDLNAHDAIKRISGHRDLIVRWIDENPPSRGIGWEPYPTSLRIVNWIKASLRGDLLNESGLHSLAIQARWLMQRLERHLLGNHLFVNAKALIFAGLYFEGSEANSWLQTGFDVLLRECDEQILSDGGQFELSPMYHALALEDILDLVNITSHAGIENFTTTQANQIIDWRKRVPTMLQWLVLMSHPDGRISFFNDAAYGVAPENEELYQYAHRLGFIAPGTSPRCGVNHLKDSGYIRLNKGPFDIIFDAAKVGPDYLPAHAHADTLSFEMSVRGERMIVNSGTSTYGSDAERLRQRGTAAHSTLELGSVDSSEVWGGFRVARRARVQAVQIKEDSKEIELIATHDGYARLSGRPIHTRNLRLLGQDVIVQDRVSGTGRHSICLRYHLHPECNATNVSDDVIKVTFGKSCSQISVTGPADLQISIEPSTWHPEFGQRVSNQMILIRHEASLPCEISTSFSVLPS